jgi:hypothetical protein
LQSSFLDLSYLKNQQIKSIILKILIISCFNIF